MTVGLYFGSFNPVHTGHLSLADYLVDRRVVDEVWFVVSPCNPLKKRADLLDERVRLEMLQLAIAGDSRLKSSDVEFDMPIPSYTCDTLGVLSSRHPDIHFSLLIGSDNALLFHRWRNAEEILARYPVLVYPRRGYDFAEVAGKYPQMRLLSTPYYDVSSTGIRADLAQGRDVSDRLPARVYDYIREKRLYENG